MEADRRRAVCANRGSPASSYCDRVLCGQGSGHVYLLFQTSEEWSELLTHCRSVQSKTCHNLEFHIFEIIRCFNKDAVVVFLSISNDLFY